MLNTSQLTKKQLQTKIKFWIAFFIVFLVLSGITAFPIESQLTMLMEHISFVPAATRPWLLQVHEAVQTTNANYPFLSYGTDWLAFAHIVIAIAFIGPYKDPVRNIWVLQFGIIACLMVLPLAIIAGYVREIPVYWRIIDCFFGILGSIPLYLCYRLIKQLETIQASNS